jgi:alcohol dehydrogenase
MKALVYRGPGQKAWEDVPKLEISADTDAIVRVDATHHQRHGSPDASRFV